MIGAYRVQEINFARDILQVHHSLVSGYINDFVEAIWASLTGSRVSLSFYQDTQWLSPNLARIVALQEEVDPYEIFGECPRSVSALFDVPADSTWSSDELR